MLFNQKFDLIFSIGEDCACSSYLRRYNLQDYSYPFDWLTKATFKTRLDLLLNDFQGFLEKENLIPMEKPNNKNLDFENDYYKDTKYDFYFYHDFKTGKSLEESFNDVKEKYNRRISRLYKNIESSNNMLLVWWSRDKHQEEDLLKEYYDKLVKKYPNKNIYLLILEYSENYKEKFLSDGHIKVVQYDNISYMHNPKWTEVMGNEKNNKKVFSQIKKYRTLDWYLNFAIYKFVNCLIGLIIIKDLRRKLRKDWQYHCLKAKL